MNERDDQINRESFLDRLKSGEEEAFQILVEEIEERLISFLYRYVRNRTVAEELFQDTMAKVIENIDEFEPRARLTTWIFTIARNAALDHLKSARHKKTTKLGGKGSEEEDNIIYLRELFPIDEPGPTEQVESRERDRLIRELVQGLDPKFRKPVMFRFFEDMKYSKIADQMEIPEGTARYRVHEALKRLSDRWLDLLETPPGENREERKEENSSSGNGSNETEKKP